MSFEMPRILAVSIGAELDEARWEGGIRVALMIELLPLRFAA